MCQADLHMYITKLGSHHKFSGQNNCLQLSEKGGLPHSWVGKKSACNSGDPGSIPGSGRSPGAGNDNSLQYSCLENPMDRGAWRATVHGFIRVRHDLATKPPPTEKGTKVLGGVWFARFPHIVNDRLKINYNTAWHKTPLKQFVNREHWLMDCRATMILMVQIHQGTLILPSLQWILQRLLMDILRTLVTMTPSSMHSIITTLLSL